MMMMMILVSILSGVTTAGRLYQVLGADSNCSSDDYRKLRQTTRTPRVSRTQESLLLRRERQDYWRDFNRSEVTVVAVNIGQGTTGTHWTVELLPETISMQHWGSFRAVDDRARAAGASALKAYNRYRHCLTPRMRKQNAAVNVTKSTDKRSKACENAQDIRHGLRQALRSVLTSGLRVVSDSPYPYMLAELLEAKPDLLLFHTMRQPDAWALRRSRSHPFDVLCAEVCGLGNKDSTGSYFELTDCCPSEGKNHDDSHQVKQFFASANNSTSDIRLHTVTTRDQAHLNISDLAAKYAAHQDYIRTLIQNSPSAAYIELCAWDNPTRKSEQATSLLHAFQNTGLEITSSFLDSTISALQQQQRNSEIGQGTKQ